MLAGVGLILISATVGLSVQQVDEVPLAEAMQLSSEIAAAIEARTGREVVIDDPTWASSCTDRDACAAEVRGRTGAQSVVLLRVFGALTLLRVAADRAEGNALDRIEVDLPREGKDRSEPLKALAEKLFPNAKPPPPRAADLAADPAPPLADTEKKGSILPWVIVGAGAAAGLGGIGFGLSSRAARNDSQSPTIDDPTFDTLADRAVSHGTAANILFGVGAAAIGVGLTLFVLE